MESVRGFSKDPQPDKTYQEWRVELIATGLSFTPEELDKHIEALMAFQIKDNDE